MQGLENLQWFVSHGAEMKRSNSNQRVMNHSYLVSFSN